MPKGSPELTEKRRNEILDACERVYKAQGFYGVNIKEISSEISLTRPSIYNYFETKEEILLGLLAREYRGWCGSLEAIIPLAPALDRAGLAEALADTLAERETLLRILCMNLFEIEQNSRLERLADFKKLYFRSVTALGGILRAYRPGSPGSEAEAFCTTFLAFLFGVYPFTRHTEKQLAAMELAGIPVQEPSIREMVSRCLLQLLPQK